MKTSDPENRRLDRREFQITVIYGLSAIIGLGLAAPAAIYLLFPPRSKKQDQWVEAGTVSRLQIGVPEELVFRRKRVDGWKVSSEKTSAWVVRKSDRVVVAFAPQCTHLGCAFRWEERKKTFLCPCHTSNFDLEGNVIDGPAPRPLDRYEVRIEGDKLFLGAIRKSEG
ncbi:MAG: ubiquinol-cytochrome c reductase iron-sulfur subunit [Bryobacteraceae bacterium]|nr:ubiquinol-cytochrome c reductase iron-sulfur subunit [Bryobacteraceae bacterium]MDW8379040.1 ubiquinol-cytochrome c reductase iron-sulfur subunit [Bryobacterales bacterium]